MKFLTTLLATISFTALTAFAGAVNKKCPVSDEDIDKDHTVKVAVTFCCENCKAKFDKDPISFAEKVSKAEEGKCPVSGKDVDKDQSSDLEVGTCCGKCETKVKEDPKKFVAKLKAD